MSLPLPRRIAQAALLLGAAAAPLVGAGAAHAAAQPQPLKELADAGGVLSGGGELGATAKSAVHDALSGTANGPLGHDVHGTSHDTAGLVGQAGRDVMTTPMRTAGHLVGTTGRMAVPAVHDAAGGAADAGGRIMGRTEESLAGPLPATESLPLTHAGAPLAPALPGVGQLPTL